MWQEKTGDLIFSWRVLFGKSGGKHMIKTYQNNCFLKPTDLHIFTKQQRPFFQGTTRIRRERFSSTSRKLSPAGTGQCCCQRGRRMARPSALTWTQSASKTTGVTGTTFPLSFGLGRCGAVMILPVERFWNQNWQHFVWEALDSGRNVVFLFWDVMCMKPTCRTMIKAQHSSCTVTSTLRTQHEICEFKMLKSHLPVFGPVNANKIEIQNLITHWMPSATKIASELSHTAPISSKASPQVPRNLRRSIDFLRSKYLIQSHTCTCCLNI